MAKWNDKNGQQKPWKLYTIDNCNGIDTTWSLEGFFFSTSIPPP